MSNADAPAVPAVLPQVRLKIARRSSHPWIFQKMVEKPAGRLPPGSVVDIIDRDGQWVGRGFYNGHSRIALRILTADPAEPIDDAFFARRLGRAVELRRDWLGLDAVTDAYRLVHSEGDGLSGLVVDRFGAVLVLEFFSAGMYRFRDAIQAALAGHYPDARFYWFAEEHVQKQESFDCRAPEPPAPEVITETRRALPRRAGQQAQDRLLPRPARQPPDAGLLLRRPARAGPVLQQRRLRRLRQGAGRRRRGGRRRSRRAGAWRWPGRTPG